MMTGTEGVVMLLIFPFLFILGLVIRRGFEAISVIVAVFFVLHLYNNPQLIVQILCIIALPFIFLTIFIKGLLGK